MQYYPSIVARSRYNRLVTMTLSSLIAELTRIAELPPVERARALGPLVEPAKSAIALARGAAMAEAVAGGMTTVALAAELGIHRSKVAEALSRVRGTSVG